MSIASSNIFLLAVNAGVATYQHARQKNATTTKEKDFYTQSRNLSLVGVGAAALACIAGYVISKSSE